MSDQQLLHPTVAVRTSTIGIALGFALVGLTITCAATGARPTTHGNQASTPALADSAACGRSLRHVWVVTPDSVGPIPASASLDEVRRLCPGARDVADSLLPYFAVAVAIPGFDDKLLVAEMKAGVPGGKASVIVIRTPRVRTREGLAVGSTLTDLRQRLGPMLVFALNEEGFFAVPRSDPKSRVQYRLEGFDAGAVPGGWTPADSAAHSDLVPGRARVTEIQVWSRVR